jgi:hypothetical protein
MNSFLKRFFLEVYATSRTPRSATTDSLIASSSLSSLRPSTLSASLLLKCISKLPSPFHQFRFLVALASAWSLTWYQTPGSRVRVLVFAIIVKLLLPPFVSTCWLSLLLFVSTCWFSPLLSVSTCWLSLLPSHVSGGVEVYKWIA